ncbi:hypothetical protein RUM44_002831 [Polyplax serrata]|uniref:CUE domain-containing protein n=1 Tax=Polyplax serrata TaxID=468196 RepID=A0ABR1AFX2_POLSC
MELRDEEINAEWVLEENRTFTVHPKLLIKEEQLVNDNLDTVTDLLHFVIEDLQWLLSLEAYKFWSHLIHSEEACTLVTSALENSLPRYLRPSSLINENVKKLLNEIEHLVFMVFVRMSYHQELFSQVSKNFDQLVYNNRLFTVPTLIEFCTMFGCDNSEMVKSVLLKLSNLMPHLPVQFKQLVPNFYRILRLVEDQFVTKHQPKVIAQTICRNTGKVKSLVHLLYDSTSAIEVFLEVNYKFCKFFATNEFISEISAFYSNVLPEIEASIDREPAADTCSSYASRSCLDFVYRIRLDLIKITRHIFNFLHSEANSIENTNEREELVDEYLTLIMDLLSEPTFLFDYNSIFPLSGEVGLLTRDTPNVDSVKQEHILQGIRELTKTSHFDEGVWKQDSELQKNMDEGRLQSLLTEIKDVLPHLTDTYIISHLKLHDYKIEKVIASALETDEGNDREDPGPSAASQLGQNLGSNRTGARVPEKSKWNKTTDEWKSIGERIDKQKYSQWFLVEDLTYQDEYDDTYDEEEAAFGILREEEEAEKNIRPFVTPRVLETGEDSEEAKEEDADEMAEGELVTSEDEVDQKERGRRATRGRTREFVKIRGGPREGKRVEQNREWKESHKSSVGNHNRKRQAERKRLQGMLRC